MEKRNYYHSTIPYTDGSYTIDYCNTEREYLRGDLWNPKDYVIELKIVPGHTSGAAMDEWYFLASAIEEGYLGY